MKLNFAHLQVERLLFREAKLHRGARNAALKHLLWLLPLVHLVVDLCQPLCNEVRVEAQLDFPPEPAALTLHRAILYLQTVRTVHQRQRLLVHLLVLASHAVAVLVAAI